MMKIINISNLKTLSQLATKENIIEELKKYAKILEKYGNYQNEICVCLKCRKIGIADDESNNWDLCDIKEHINYHLYLGYEDTSVLGAITIIKYFLEEKMEEENDVIS